MHIQKLESIFANTLHFPDYDDLPGKEISKIYPCLLDLIRSHKARPITRQKLEQVINDALSENFRLPSRPVTIITEIEKVTQKEKSLQFEWEAFFGGASREYPPANEWNTILKFQLNQTSKWIKENRRSRRVELRGSRRISTA
ncbi:hypothetical protein [Paenibacillus sp. JGP012]|uniref:hypothetical protein n=1 Tax=Paenibacillus sp. JGP012 TaxID=2735914 RepID=UPI001C88D8AA|nr:hypothetical protein [Paenibacillus sp. JGP012]